DRGGPSVDQNEGPHPARGDVGWAARVAQGQEEELRVRPPHLAEGGGTRESAGRGTPRRPEPGARATGHGRTHGRAHSPGGPSPIPLPQAMGVRLRLTAW